MATLKFEGHSDDTFGEYEHFQDDYDNCASGSSIVFKVEADGEGMYVHGQYSGKGWPDDTPGCWMIGIQQLDEDIALPKWPLRFELGDCGYSPSLVLEVPDSVTMTCLNRTDD